MNELILRVSFAVFTGHPDVSYARVNGFTSTLEGLAEWYGFRAVSHSLDGPEPALSGDLTVTIRDPQWLKVDARLNLSLGAGARYRLSSGFGRTEIVAWGGTQTLVARPRPWSDHLERHQSIHQLLELSAWRPLGFEQITALRQDDPETVLTGAPIGERWARVRTYEVPVSVPGPRRLQFHFTYEDIGAVGFRRWLRLREDFSRGIYALAFSIRHRATSLEGLISDAGIGLEEIGHGLQLQVGGSVSRRHHKKLEAIAAEVEHLLPFDGTDWASRSTEVYNDVKHADRPAADADVMVESLRENRIVFRTWLATRVGVSDDVIRKGTWILERS